MSDNEKDAGESGESSKYTHEIKVVTAVWVHEKEYNNQTWKDIYRNFLIRFGLPPPSRSTFMNWERKLFDAGSIEDKEKSGRPLSRLMHVPYVRQSLKESPELSIRERSKILGLPRTTLLKIIREDLNMEYEVEPDSNNYYINPNKRHAPSGGGKWVKRAHLEATETETANDAVDVLHVQSNVHDQADLHEYLHKFQVPEAEEDSEDEEESE